MFSSLFDNLIMTDSLAKELERFNALSLERLNALSRKEKEEPKKTVEVVKKAQPKSRLEIVKRVPIKRVEITQSGTAQKPANQRPPRDKDSRPQDNEAKKDGQITSEEYEQLLKKLDDLTNKKGE